MNMSDIKIYRKRLDSAKSIRQYLGDIMHDLREDEISESKARTLAYISSIMLQAIDRADLERRLDELEKHINDKAV